MRGDLEWGTVPKLVRDAAEKYAEREAVVEGRTRVSYAELGERVERAAAACIAAGVEKGDRVAVWAPNTLDWIVSALGAVTAGAVLVPLNTRFKGTEAAYVLRRSRARLLFVTGTFLGTSYVASLRRADVRTAGAGTGGRPRRQRPRGLPHLEGLPGRRRHGHRRRGPRPRRRGGAVGALRHRLHLRHHRQAQGRRDHPRADPAVLRRVERTRRAARGRPLSDREPLLPHLRLQGRDHRLPHPRRDDGAPARLQRRHGPREHRRGTHLRPAGTAHPAPVAPRPSRPRPARPLRAAAGRHRCGGRAAAAGRTAAGGAAHRHRADRLRPLGGERHRHHVPPRRCARDDRLHVRAGDPRHRGPGGRAPPASRARCWSADTTSCRATSRIRRRRPRSSTPTAGCTRATSASSTRRATSASPTASRTCSSSAASTPTRPRSSNCWACTPTSRTSPWSGCRTRGSARWARRTPYGIAGSTLTADDLIAWSRREMANYKVPREVEFVGELPRNASGKILKRELRGPGPSGGR